MDPSLRPPLPNAEERAVAARLAVAAERVERRAGRRPSYVPDTENRDAGYAFFRFRDGLYLYEARERGRVCVHRTTTSADQLVRWLVEDLARDVTPSAGPPRWWRRTPPRAERVRSLVAHALAGEPALALGGDEETQVARRLADVVSRLERVSGRRPAWVPTTENRDGGYDFYRYADPFYRWAAHERGVAIFERSTRSQDSLVEWIAISLVRDCATTHEVAHRVAGEDSRRQWFGLWEEWSRALDPAWGDEVAARVARILRTAPFDDGPQQ